MPHAVNAAPRTGVMALVRRITARMAMRNVQRIEQRGSATGRLIALQTGGGEPVWSPRDYAAFAREGMMQNAIVYRCVRMIAENAAAVPLLTYDGDEEIEDHPLLALLERPSPIATGAELLESFYGFLLVSGNAYVEAAGYGGSVRELHALRPDRMKVVPGADGWPIAWEYSAGGETVRISGDVADGVPRILHLKLFHPANDHYGLSPIEAASTAIDIHNAASRWNKALLDNSARPSGALVYGGGQHLAPDQFLRLKEELSNAFQGARNAGRPMLLEGGLDWKAMSLSPRDMDFIDAKHAAAREIALALGVPPMLLGIPGDNTYANYAEANRAFWRSTVLPLVQRTSSALSRWLSPAFDGRVRLVPDLDQIDALSPEREALWSRLENASFLTDDEKRAAVGYAAKGEEDEAADGPLARKYCPGQARDDRGRWTDEGGGFVHRVSRRGPVASASPAQQMRLSVARRDAQEAVRRARELDPTWREPQSIYEGVEGQIGHHEAVAAAARSRLAELTRDALPNSNPAWGVNRLRKELNGRGFRLERPADSPGFIYRNSDTGEAVRLMERTSRPWRSDPPEKHYFQYYYRYRPSDDQREGRHVPIPDKD